ncbi:MAG: Maf family nucleotide pyrophosphatase [Cyclobacteriaceae bacterium]|nr:Maf family nucleotide pyrophosphatase [Cyclobacteriaceae bacterium]
MIQLQYPLILASASPRRQELLRKLNFPFTVQTVAVEEQIPNNIKPKDAALYLANLKGEAHDFLAKHHIVITADTIVILNEKILDKPTSANEAKSILAQLSDNTHEVITGVSIRANNEVHSFNVSTKVTFGALSKKEIAYYVNSGNANDKAGAYGIQDWIGLVGVSSIEGSYYNVMGLPTLEIYFCLKKHFIKK